ncbi:unnamed protein product, partial [Urochloa humidicola]
LQPGEASNGRGSRGGVSGQRRPQAQCFPSAFNTASFLLSLHMGCAMPMVPCFSTSYLYFFFYKDIDVPRGRWSMAAAHR